MGHRYLFTQNRYDFMLKFMIYRTTLISFLEFECIVFIASSPVFPVRFSLLFVVAILFHSVSTTMPVYAGTIRLTCRFNYQQWIGLSQISIGNGFRFVWDDGPTMSYKEVSGRSYADNLYIDSLGGSWHIRDLRDGRSFDLLNLKNGNVIQCR